MDRETQYEVAMHMFAEALGEPRFRTQQPVTPTKSKRSRKLPKSGREAILDGLQAAATFLYEERQTTRWKLESFWAGDTYGGLHIRRELLHRTNR